MSISNPQSATTLDSKVRLKTSSKHNSCLLMTKGGSSKEFEMHQVGDSKQIVLERASSTSSTSKVEHCLERAHAMLLPEMDATQDSKGKFGVLFPIKIVFLQQSSRKIYFTSGRARRKALDWILNIQGFKS